MEAEKTEKIVTNTPKAYIHFERATAVAFFHNSREAFLPQTSFEELRSKNICDRTAAEARALFQKLDAEADAAFYEKSGRRTNMKEGNKIWEYVCLLKEENTWEDVERLMRRVEQETGYTTLQASLHEDEGHFDENGVFKKNRHIQVDVFTRSLEDGRSLCLENYGRKDLMKKLQKIVSEELGLEEGEPKEITKRKHIPHRKYRAMKEAQNNKEWEQKLEKTSKEWEAKMAEKQAEWEQKKAEWEAKQAAREARQAEWEKKLPEIMARKEQYSKFIIDKIDWEAAKTGKKLAYEMEMLGRNFAGINNPHGNILLEAQKDAIRNVFKMLGVTAQLAVFLLNKTLQNDEKIKSDAKIYNVESTLLRAVDYVANSDPANGEELKKLIQRTFRTIPEDRRRELFEYAIENAPTEELRNDIKALVEGRFDDIARTEAAQKRIENRDLRRELKEYSEEIKRIKEELRAMDEENRILNLAERALLREKGANREEYADQEAENRKRIEDIKKLKDDVKALNNTIQEQKQTQEKDVETIKKQAAQIKELTDKIAEITTENAKKQRELEAEKEQAEKDKIELKDKIEELEAEKIIPQDIFDEINRVHYGIEPETPHDMAIDERDAALDERDEALKRVKELEEQLKEPISEEPKPEPVKPEPEQKPAKDDNLNIYGYSTPKPEPRRRLDEYPRKALDASPKYELEPIREPEPVKQPEKPRDEWQEIEEAMKKWQKEDSVVEKSLMGRGLRLKLDEYEKKNGEINGERREIMRRYRVFLSYDPLEAEREAQKHAETLRKMDALNREREQKRQAAEIQTEKKYDDAKKNVRAEADAKQRDIKKKRKDELEMGMG